VVNVSSHHAVLEVLERYFGGIYSGDVAQLGSTFHPRAILGGEVKGQPYYKTVEEYLDAVRNRKSPKELGEPFAMKVISVEVQGSIALAKAHCPMLGFNYFDYLSFVLLEGRWVIVSKVFTHLVNWPH
jgi:hypothetical protein